jgi:2'-5' RNA ligase
MDGIVSLLDKEHDLLVKEIWVQLENRCGLTGLHATPHPHFSWHIAEAYDLEPLKGIMKKVIIDEVPFNVHTSGIAVFKGETPVVYVPIARTKKLSELHEKICESVSPISTIESTYYLPDYWMPHISLGFVDLNLVNIDCLVEKIRVQNLKWSITIDNIALIYEQDTSEGSTLIEMKFPSTDIHKKDI